MEATQETASGPRMEPVKEKAADLARAAEGRARGLLDHQKDTAAKELGSIAGALREASGKMGETDGTLSACMRWAADTAQRLSGELQGRSMEDLLRSGRDLARRNPAVFVGAAAVAGVILGRFLRAGGQRLVHQARPRQEGEAA
jgi:hypothetical protein